MANQLSFKIKESWNFISDKIRSFKYLTLGEQVSFGSIGLGIIFILVSVVLFIV